MFSFQFSEIFHNSFFQEHHWATTFEDVTYFKRLFIMIYI